MQNQNLKQGLSVKQIFAQITFFYIAAFMGLAFTTGLIAALF